MIRFILTGIHFFLFFFFKLHVLNNELKFILECNHIFIFQITFSKKIRVSMSVCLFGRYYPMSVCLSVHTVTSAISLKSYYNYILHICICNVETLDIQTVAAMSYLFRYTAHLLHVFLVESKYPVQTLRLLGS